MAAAGAGSRQAVILLSWGFHTLERERLEILTATAGRQSRGSHAEAVGGVVGRVRHLSETARAHYNVVWTQKYVWRELGKAFSLRDSTSRISKLAKRADVLKGWSFELPGAIALARSGGGYRNRSPVEVEDEDEVA